MAAVITRSSHPDFLWPGVLMTFGLNYDEFPDIYSQIFDEVDGELATERLIESTGFGLARTKSESSPITYDADAEGYATLATPNVIALGYQVTREELEDNLYAEVSERRAASLAFSMHTTIEMVHANLLINAFSSSNPLYVYGDGQPLCSASHPTKNGTQSNLPTVNADFSEASLEDMIKRVYLAQNSRGLQISLRPRKIIVSAADMFNTTRVLESQLRTSTANNDINAVKQMGLIPEGALVNPYLGVEATQAWWLQTSIERDKGLVSIWRRYPELEKDNDFDTENLKAKSTARFIPSVGDWRALFGTPGF
jgi:hypothetical protein